MRTLTTLAFVALCTLGSGAAVAQQPTSTYKRDVPDSLAAQAKVGEDSARAVALRRVPGGTIQELELEREDGKLVYSFDIKVAGKAGITEVLVDALTGKVVSVEHEAH